jgi:ABC-type transport system involved in Fe-S cluster assembly fused permease/ATPase subunit
MYLWLKRQLDRPENEVLIQEPFRTYPRKTVIVIAHRLKTVAGANKIVLEEGNLSTGNTRRAFN